MKNLIKWFRERLVFHWKNYPIQMLGMFVLIAAFIAAIIGGKQAIVLAWSFLICVGIYDIYLIYVTKEITITKWIRGLTGHKVDNIIMLSLIPLCWWLKGETVALWFLLGLLNNHLFEKD